MDIIGATHNVKLYLSISNISLLQMKVNNVNEFLNINYFL